MSRRIAITASKSGRIDGVPMRAQLATPPSSVEGEIRRGPVFATSSKDTYLYLARSVGSLRRNHTSEVGGEADMPRQLNRRI